MPEEHVVFSGIVRKYYGEPDGTGHAPYRGMLHDLDDKKAKQDQVRLFDGLAVPPDKRVEIVVRITDEDVPLGRDPWVLLRPHRYGPRSTLETCWRCGGKLNPREALVFGWTSLRAWVTGARRDEVAYHKSYVFTDCYLDEDTLASCAACWSAAISRAKAEAEATTAP